MTIEYITENSIPSKGWRVSSGGCELPPSETTNLLLLCIVFGNDLGLSTTLNTPTVGVVSGTLVASSARSAVYSFPGGTTGTAQFTFSTNPASFQAIAVVEKGQKTTSPHSSGYSASTSGFVHTLSAGTTAPFPGAVFFAVAGSGASISGVTMDSPDNIVVIGGGPDLPSIVVTALSAAVRYAAAAGDPGVHSWSSTFGGSPVNVFAGLCGFWVSPLQAPSPPVVITPATNDQITAGKTVDITYTASTDPNFASSALTYQASYTNNNGITVNVIGTAAAGVLTIAWNTTGLSPGLYKVYVRGYNGTDYGEYGVSGEFRIYADTVPNPPTQLAPTGYIAKDQNQRFSWKANNPDADTQSAYELMWDNDPAFGSSSTTGTVASANEFHDFTANNDILSTADTFYWRVRTKGFVDNTFGGWSQIATVITRNAPATPNITAPTAGSPPTVGQFTGIFTSTGHVEYAYRVVQGSLSYSSGWLPGSVTSFLIAISVANSVACTLYVKIKDSFGLESAEDSETFTPSYTGPTTPLLDLTTNEIDGTIQCAITNPVTVAAVYSRIKRWEDGEAESTAIWITPRLPNNSTFIHSQAAAGVTYNFRAVAFLATGGYTESTIETATVEFTELQIHTVTKSLTTGDAELSVSISIEGKTSDKIEKNQESVAHLGRTKYLTYAGVSGNYERMIYNCFIPRSDTQTIDKLLAILAADRLIWSGDRNGRALFGRFLNVDLNRIQTSDRFSLEVIEQRHREGIR